jgi:hypothetical protein
MVEGKKELQGDTCPVLAIALNITITHTHGCMHSINQRIQDNCTKG